MTIEISEEARRLLLEIARCDTFYAFGKDMTLDTPCGEILRCQSGTHNGERQLPVPWVGDIENVPILFISSNPAIKQNERVALESWSDEKIVDFHAKWL